MEKEPVSFLKGQSCHQKGPSGYMAGNTTPPDIVIVALILLLADKMTIIKNDSSIYQRKGDIAKGA